MRSRVLASLCLLLLTSGCINNASPVSTDQAPPTLARVATLLDPLQNGPYTYTVKEYDQGTVTVGGRDQAHKNYSYPARLRGVLFAPQGEGPFPILLFLHGQHGTCGFAGRESFIGPPPPIASGNCEGPSPWHPYPNHRGYDYLGEHLASHGYVVLSLLAKEINERNGNPDIGMWARGELLIATLDMLQEAQAGTRDLGVTGKLDFTRIGLMGHSRGGEGVVTATHVNALRTEPYMIRAVIPLAPTDFNRRGVEGAATLSLVPYCDGDVFSLHGLRTYDHSRFLDDHTTKVQVLVFGANHNNYNTRWGKGEVAGIVRDGDDAPPGRHLNPECDLNRGQQGGRLTSDDTLREGLLHMAGFFRWVLGPEESLAAYFTGAAAMPSVACPAKTSTCPDAVRISALLPGRRWIFNVTEEGLNPLQASTATTEGFDSVRACSQTRCASNVYSSAWSLDVTWKQKARIITQIPPGLLQGMDVLAFRAAVPTQGDHNQPNRLVDLNVALLNADGTRNIVAVSAHSRALLHPAGETAEANGQAIGNAKVSLNMVRIPLEAFGSQAANATAIELSFDRTPSGRLLISELYAQPELGTATGSTR